MTLKSKDNAAQYLFHEGTNFAAYEFMGVHRVSGDGLSGYEFRVWAPHAESVYIAGDFNEWKPVTPLSRETDAGLWSCVLPEEKFAKLSRYKFIIKSGDKYLYKADPYAFYCEVPPNTASVFYDIEGFEWNDSAWLAHRRSTVKEPEYSMPMNIYEIHPASWKTKENGEYLSYRELAHELAAYVKQMGYTHVELMPISEYPFDGSWGYQVCGYYAPTSRFGTPQDFMYFVDYMHRAGIGVILDWVPAHFPKDEHGLYEFDGKPLYEYQGEDKMENRGWGTRKFDVGRNEVESFLISNAMFWLRKYHIDGLRVDAVASMLYLDYDKQPGEWLPNAYGGKECLEAIAFFQKLGTVIRREFPEALFIAEESTAWKNVSKKAEWDGLGFNYKWNMGWMNDTLDYFSTDPLFRKYKHEKVTFSMMYAYSENFILPISHDEVVHGKKSLLDKMPGDYGQKFAGVRVFLAYMMTHPGKKLLFMGSEIGQFKEWDYKGSIEWFLLSYDMHAKLQSYVRELNFLYLENSELWEVDYSWDGFRWIDANNRDLSILSYVRSNKKGEKLVVLLKLTPVERRGFTCAVPDSGTYREIFNSDSERFGGSGMTNAEPMRSKKNKSTPEGFAGTISVDLPPLGAVILRHKARSKPAANVPDGKKSKKAAPAPKGAKAASKAASKSKAASATASKAPSKPKASKKK